MPELSRHPQNELVVWPLFLPQFYWVLLKNAHVAEFRAQIEKQDRIPTWEKNYLQALSRVGLFDKNDIRPIWTNDYSLLVMERVDTNGPFNTGKSLYDFLIQVNDIGPNSLIQKKGRLDIKLGLPAEAIGFLAFHGEDNKVRDDSPSGFFRKLILGDISGETAAAYVLARYFSLHETTFTGVKSAPREIVRAILNGTFEPTQFLEDELPNEHPQATLKAYIDALRGWLSNPTVFREIINRLLSVAARCSPLTPTWRNELPPKELIDECEKLMNNGPQIKSGGVVGSSQSTHPQTILLIGPPGTGKTTIGLQLAHAISKAKVINSNFGAQKINEICKSPLKPLDKTNLNVLVTQLHQSYAYEDFIEGLRPTPPAFKNGDSIRYEVTPGPLKVMAQLARCYWEHWKKETNAYRIPVLAINTATGSRPGLRIAPEFLLYQLQNRKGELRISQDEVEDACFAKTGEGKIFDFTLESENCYLPLYWVPTDLDESKPEQFVLLVDELNRGNPTKIFGDAFVLLETTKRLGHNEATPVILPYSKEEFILTDNFHLVATMNQADRSLATIDQAFRRRFTTRFLAPDFDLLTRKTIDFGAQQVDDTNKKIASHLDDVNKALSSVRIDQDRHVGHFYGIEALKDVYQGKLSVTQALTRLWNEHLHPLLRDIIPERDVETFASKLNDLQTSNKLHITNLDEKLKTPDPSIEVIEKEAA